MKMKNQSERTKKYREKQKKSGFIRKSIFVSQEQWEKLKPILDKIKKGEI